MEIYTTTTTVSVPSHVGTPACSHASVRTTRALGASRATVVRERDAVLTGAKGDMGFGPANGFAIDDQGSPAWSPPTS